ncbi:MAG: hypothetical protein J2O49_06835, partial [Sciscionella sp.]|nr:hypothetical protein [Sciscionella sp.]
VRTLQTRTDTAATLNGAKGAKFTVEVPRDWTKFTEQRTSDVLPTSTVVHYIAPDGKQQITIERLAAFYPRASIARYFTAIQRQWPEHQVNQISVKQIPGLGGGVGAEEPAQSLVFRSTDLAERGGNSVARTTFVDAFPDGPDLWAVSVIVPTDEEDSGNSGLFAKVAPSFKPID